MAIQQGPELGELLGPDILLTVIGLSRCACRESSGRQRGRAWPAANVALSSVSHRSLAQEPGAAIVGAGLAWRCTMKQSFPLDSLALDRSLSVPLHRQLYGHLAKHDRRARPRARTCAAVVAIAGAGPQGRRETPSSAFMSNCRQRATSWGSPGFRLTVVDLPVRTAPEVHAKTTDRRRIVSARGQLMLRQPAHHGAPGTIGIPPRNARCRQLSVQHLEPAPGAAGQGGPERPLRHLQRQRLSAAAARHRRATSKSPAASAAVRSRSSSPPAPRQRSTSSPAFCSTRAMRPGSKSPATMGRRRRSSRPERSWCRCMSTIRAGG